MKTLLLSFFFGIISIIGFLFTPGEAVPGAEVYIEMDGQNDPVAFQQTGDNGKVTFSHLNSGVYRINVELPQQSGKLMRRSNNLDCKLQVGYHKGKKQYYLREEEGFFTINYSKLKRFSGDNITPVYKPAPESRKERIEIGKFEVSGNNGSFTMEVRAQKPKKFQKMVEKAIDDVEMVTIRNVR